jgi:hypothetical protein
MEEETVSKEEYIKVVEERNKVIKILQNIFQNMLDIINLYDIENVDFNKILCRECICKVCINEDCPGRLCNEDGFKCDWKDKEKEPVFECECFEKNNLIL